MNKEIQAKVRVMAETVINNLHELMSTGQGGTVEMGMLVANFEIARQMALVAEELHRLNRVIEKKEEA